MPNWELIISFGDLYEVKWKNNVIFGFLDSRNLYFNIHHAKLVNWKFWPLIGGQRSFGDISMRSKWKNNVIFGFLGPKNLYFNIHHAKWVNSKFWPLIRGQRSFGDLYEVKMKKYCHFWIPWPKKPIFQHTSCKVSEIKILTSFQRSEVIWWPLQGQNEKKMSFLDSLAQKTYISTYIMQSQWIQNFDLWSEVRGHRMTSKRSD